MASFFFEQISISDLISLSTYKTKCIFNSLCANFTKWSNTLKQFIGKLPTNCFSVFGHFVRLVLKELNSYLANWWCYKLDDLIYICLKFYHSLSPSLGLESTDPRPTSSKLLLLLWYEGYQELNKRVGSHCPVQPSLSVEFKPRTFESHCASIPIWKIKKTIYEK